MTSYFLHLGGMTPLAPPWLRLSTKLQKYIRIVATSKRKYKHQANSPLITQHKIVQSCALLSKV